MIRVPIRVCKLKNAHDNVRHLIHLLRWRFGVLAGQFEMECMDLCPTPSTLHGITRLRVEIFEDSARVSFVPPEIRRLDRLLGFLDARHHLFSRHVRVLVEPLEKPPERWHPHQRI